MPQVVPGLCPQVRQMFHPCNLYLVLPGSICSPGHYIRTAHFVLLRVLWGAAPLQLLIGGIRAVTQCQLGLPCQRGDRMESNDLLL